MAASRGWALFATLAVCALVAACAIRFVTLRTDMADFLPTGGSEAARLMLREISSGEAAKLVLIGIDSAPPADLAALSGRLRAGLLRSNRFELVQNGQSSLDALLESQAFAARYLLSETTAEIFETASLRADLDRLLAQLQSSASPLVSQIGLADPTGAFVATLRRWGSSSRIRLENGVWFAPDGERAVLLAKLPSGAIGSSGQADALAAVEEAFRAAAPGGAQLRISGPAAIAREAARTIRSDVEFLSILSTIFIAAVLLWRFRSLWILAIIAVPIVLSIAMASLVVQFVFGFVHGIAFGFGMTMLGVSVDYPVLLIGHRKTGERASATLQRIGEAFRLAVCSVAVGLAGLAFSGFPGLAQLGLFATTGLLVAALVTWWVLPPLIVAIDLAPVPALDDARTLRVEGLRRWRVATLALPVLAVVVLAVTPPRWEDDLRNMSPVSPEAQALDRDLRRSIGAADAGQLLFVSGDTVDEVLRRQEGLAPRIERLRQDGILAGAEYAARLLPSVATQRSRQGALPRAEDLAARMAAATSGTDFREDAFRPFLDAVEANRSMSPLTPDALVDPLLAARVRATLFAFEGRFYGALIPQGVADWLRLRAALADEHSLVHLDIRAELDAEISAYTRQAWASLGGGAALVVMVLAIGLREVHRIVRVTGTTLAAGLCCLAVLSLLGLKLSMVTIVSMQLALGVGLDYALFFARRQLDAEERARTLRTLAICATMTLATFGLLAACRTPLLRDMGLTVVLGVLFSMIFAFQFAGERQRQS